MMSLNLDKQFYVLYLIASRLMTKNSNYWDGISGVTAADIFANFLQNKITIISAETEYFFSGLR